MGCTVHNIHHVSLASTARSKAGPARSLRDAFTGRKLCERIFIHFNKEQGEGLTEHKAGGLSCPPSPIHSRPEDVVGTMQQATQCQPSFLISSQTQGSSPTGEFLLDHNARMPTHHCSKNEVGIGVHQIIDDLSGHVHLHSGVGTAPFGSISLSSSGRVHFLK